MYIYCQPVHKFINIAAMNPFWKGLLSEEAGAADRMIFFPDYSEIELQQFG